MIMKLNNNVDICIISNQQFFTFSDQYAWVNYCKNSTTYNIFIRMQDATYIMYANL